MQDEGSPPQVRGKRTGIALIFVCSGITPAGAGKTQSLYIFPNLLQDHPRRCGENRSKEQKSAKYVGSPPQVRGKPLWQFPRNSLDRITPAGAGKTQTQPNYFEKKKDHPRRCGENRQRHGGTGRYTGSPPQVRGKRAILPPNAKNFRITPAGAGKTTPILLLCACHSDHPRRCGENSVISPQILSFPGSPPQVRGKLNYGNL